MIRIRNIVVLAFDYFCTYVKNLFYKPKSEKVSLVAMPMPDPYLTMKTKACFIHCFRK